ncbi:hypothetical protein RirG_068060 [Rhizophagus irregularis DAOM 197198w]|uniref:Uncharacterized protein n=1 Tax=Rhizophagus irregularis (strain DAOM 197198w) TaxID=1432141 RepID=A0A015JYZ5_RHIIW|nr:hypothetical protein RirG_068060 [Rhizophagus irregularis DAOM 197198w]
MTLDTNTIELIAKIRHFYQNNNMRLAESNSRQNNDNIQKLIDESAFFEIENDNDDHEGEGGYEEYFEEVEIPKYNHILKISTSGQNYENFGLRYAVTGQYYGQKKCLISEVYGMLI